MKTQISTASKLLMVGLLVFLMGSCQDETTNDTSEKYIKQIKELKQEIEKLKKELGAVNSKKPGNIISPKEAKELYDNYQNTRVLWTNKEIRAASRNPKFEATKSLDYNLDSLHNYLAYIKRISKDAGIKPMGLRFYFGAYNKDYEREKSKDYAYRQTIFIAPTTSKPGAKDEQFGYTISDNNKVEYLSESYGLDVKGSSKQRASLFNINLNGLFGSKSTIANELSGTPPLGANH